MSTETTYPVKAAATTFRIIETLHELDGAGVAELADYLDMPKSTVHDHLRTLTEIEYLVQRDGEYHVGVRFLELGGYVRNELKLHRVAAPEIKKLAEDTGEHANLVVEEHGMGIFLNKVKGKDAVQLDTHVGMRVHLHTTATGKAILAFLPEDRLDEIIEQHGLPAVTKNTITDRETLKEELAEIRERGYAIDDEERVEGMRCVAAPLRDSSGYPIGGLSVSGPMSRFNDDVFVEEIPNKVLSTANVIEVNMTYA
ncbi:IclR family transcriptional regulator [Natronoglomus mannanivorans]|uniref:IclR family transcriptional regulator n=1 Tax=Natronoglomus mannanivorans TaxID=2979990 RepID=A0AAP2Z165_9EURY|nr:IclR family transcriptional regulator [Halobacteria archaeon AArc-xg1-1]